MPRFSVIMPVFNAAKYLCSTLDSVAAQTFLDWECVCVDDGSTDSSGTILDDYAHRDCRFKVIHQENGGEGAARNAALKMARGEWITCLDADDMYAPDRLEFFDNLIKSESPDLIRCRLKFIPENATTVAVASERDGYEIFCGCEAKQWGWTVLFSIGMACTWTIKRELLNGLSFRTDMRVKVDGIFCARIANRLGKVVSSHYVSYFYRQVPTSAIQVKHSVRDVLALFNAISDVWDRENACTEARSIMQSRLRFHCESEVVDWVATGTDLTRYNISKVYVAYRRVYSKCGFSGISPKEKMLKPGVFMFTRYGNVSVLKMTVALINFIRSCKAFFRSRLPTCRH